MSQPDKASVACNYKEATKFCRKGALCYVQRISMFGKETRLRLLIKSSGGRWIEKYELWSRLNNFRLKTIPEGHPRFSDERMWFDHPEGTEKILQIIEILKSRYDDPTREDPISPV